MMDDYYYELKYKNDEFEVVMRFNAEINADELKSNLKDFLKATSWSHDIVEYYMFNEEDPDEVREKSCKKCGEKGENSCRNCGIINLE